MGFAKDFRWGVASASYQIEGAAYEDGKGLSTWDVFCRKEDAIWNGHTGDVACDHYHRYREDIALMRELGVNAYRLSLSWPRVLPEGTGATNPKGLDFYDRLVNGLLDAGIEPWITLFHWDYPQALFLRDGWLNPDSSDWFAEYAGVVVDRLSDRVSHWFTLNEPLCFIGAGHAMGMHAPGLKLPTDQVLQAGHNALLAHGKAVQTIRAQSKQTALVGFAPCGDTHYPETDSPEDIAAARAATLSTDRKSMGELTWWLDPVFKGHYPEESMALYGNDAPKIAAGDMEIISQKIDICGVNIYTSGCVRAGKDGKPEHVPSPLGYPMTTQGNWRVTPKGLYWAPKFLYENYGKPIVITENGHQNNDSVMLDGKVHDPQRIDYLNRYLLELRRAAADGVPVLAYFLWTIMDNFEWREGYKIRVGLVHVDFETQKRTPKDSFYWYKKVIGTNGKSLDDWSNGVME